MLVSTDVPGFGNFKSPPSAVVQPLPMLAVNMAGKDAAAARLDIGAS